MTAIVNLKLESHKADVGIRHWEAVEYWWLQEDKVIVMGYHPENHPIAFVYTLTSEEVVNNWVKMCEEGWWVQQWTTKADVLMQQFGLLAVCSACGHWAKANEDGNCVLCDGIFEH